MSKEFEKGFNKGVNTCIDIMGDLDDNLNNWRQCEVEQTMTQISVYLNRRFLELQNNI